MEVLDTPRKKRTKISANYAELDFELLDSHLSESSLTSGVAQKQEEVLEIYAGFSSQDNATWKSFAVKTWGSLVCKARVEGCQWLSML